MLYVQDQMAMLSLILAGYGARIEAAQPQYFSKELSETAQR